MSSRPTDGATASIVGSMSVEELRDRLARREPVVLLDVREPEERTFAVIDASTACAELHVPMGRVPAEVETVSHAMATHRGAPLVVYCHHGVRSKMVGRWLVAQGVSPVLNLEGGIDAWSIAIDPTVDRY